MLIKRGGTREVVTALLCNVLRLFSVSQARIHIRTYVNTYTHIHTYIHTYAQTHTITCAVGTEQSEDLPGFHSERSILRGDHGQRTKLLRGEDLRERSREWRE